MIPSKKSSLFTNKIKSRFNFVEDFLEEENVCVPQKINEIISKKTSTYYFMRNIDVSPDACEEYIKKHCDDEEWKEFILNVKKEFAENDK